MLSTANSEAARVRKELGYPVIDTDGHMIENTPVVFDYVRSIGGESLLRAFQQRSGHPGPLTAEQRRDDWIPVGPWWPFTTDALDRATAATPGLLRSRLDELGIDFTILYPSNTMGSLWREQSDVRSAACRAVNDYLADTYRDVADRITPAALIPMHTPEEAISELEHVRELGLKAIVMPSFIKRPIPRAAREHPELSYLPKRLDTYGIDSDYDYDPVWAKCVELGFAPTFHSVLYDYGARQSISNFMYNHLGHFGAAGGAVCKSLFFGGVTRRFPTLKFAFLEGGVAWGCQLYSDMVARWGKRGKDAIERLDPQRLDVDKTVGWMGEYGDSRIRGKLEEIRAELGRSQPAPYPVHDDWDKAGVQTKEDIKRLFIESFFFGCEADDPLNAWAFNRTTLPLDAQLRIVFGSDIGHWDVPDMREVVEEAHELLEDGLLTREQLRDFLFVNPIRLHAGMNRDFFRGTVVESEVARLLPSV